MFSVNSVRQLSKMFFSLHIVFLSAAIVEGSTPSGGQRGKPAHYGHFIVLLWSFWVSYRIKFRYLK